MLKMKKLLENYFIKTIVYIPELCQKCKKKNISLVKTKNINKTFKIYVIITNVYIELTLKIIHS